MKLNSDLYCYKITKVLKVVDGDTLDVMIDLGFDIHVKKRIRLNGIDAPECRTRDLEEKKRGLAAKDKLKELCSEGSLVVKSCGIGKYGRVLGEIYTRGVNINNILLSEGHAVQYHK